jgi:hypothetical protein
LVIAVPFSWCSWRITRDLPAGRAPAGDRHLNFYETRDNVGDVISSSIAESAVNQVISRRMVKKQQMRWSPRGAHLLLQLRTRVLNDSLADDFHRWHPGFTHVPDRQALAA